MNNTKIRSKIEKLCSKIIDTLDTEESIKKIIQITENSDHINIGFSKIKPLISKTNDINTLIAYGKFLYRNSDYQQAIKILQKATKLSKENPISWYFLIESYRKLKLNNSYNKAFKNALKYTNNNTALVNLKNPFAANDHYCYKCLSTKKINELELIEAQKPQSDLIHIAYYHYACAKLYFKINIPHNALNNLFIAIEIIPTEYRFWTLLSMCMIKIGEIDQAFSASLEAVTLQQNNYTIDFLINTSRYSQNYFIASKIIDSELRTNKSNGLRVLNAKLKHIKGESDASIKILEELFTTDFKDEAHLNKALIEFELKRYQDAFQSFSKISTGYSRYENNPENKLYHLLCASFLNHWDFVNNNKIEVLESIYKMEKLNSIAPAFYILSLTDDINKQIMVSKLVAKEFFPIQSTILTERFNLYKNHKKPRIGYLSGDIGNHIVSEILIELLNNINKDILDIYIFSYRPNDNSPQYLEIQKKNNFFDISFLSNEKSALKILEQEIDILIDLTAFTSNSRSKILSFRPAPIQIHQTGFPSITGAKDIYDFKILKESTFSTKMIDDTCEQILEIPLPNHTSFKKNIKYTSTTKDKYSLPSNKFILASFNEPHKISSDIINIWGQLLSENSNCILWIYCPNRINRLNILKKIKQFRIKRSRIVFAERTNFIEHKQRLHCADLILDTFPYNNHSSAKVALESGVPIVSIEGESIVSRVSSLHLRALGLDEMISTSINQYYEIIAKFINNEKFRQQVKDKLNKQLLLSDNTSETNSYLIDYETCILKLYNQYMVNLTDAHDKPSFITD